MGDFDRLLDGLEGNGRAARERLLRRLRDDGVPFEELERAVAEQRLVLLPIERELRGEPKYTRREMAEVCEVDPEALDAVRRAAGLPLLDPNAREFSEADVEAGRRLKRALDAGMPLEGVIDANRVMGRALAQIAAAMRQLVGEAVLREAGDEEQAAQRLVEVARMLMPGLGPTMEHFFARHLLEIIRSDVLDAEQLESGTIGAARETAVGFADLVGFTRLGGRVPAEDLGAVARRLEALALDTVHPGVRLVKTIGDAVMLTAADAEGLLRCMLDLSAAVDAEGEEFPQVRCGVALGPAIERDGDLYGHVVNLASRVTGLARPGSVLTTVEVREAAEDGFRWSFAGERRVKGVGEVKLFRARLADDGGGPDEV
ncbi:MAG TPA: adenylate cyclase regulatory domain-containing protein [Solirubrobacteraceae bacterium]|nr:adenylate cyclase regulatory domain-containing protein [Solirubrobacteraceae bacterium]